MYNDIYPGQIRSTLSPSVAITVVSGTVKYKVKNPSSIQHCRTTLRLVPLK